MKRRTVSRPLQQLDFWPELRSPGMSFYAALSARRAPARSVSEDGRTVRSEAASARKGAHQVPDGNHGDITFGVTQ